MPQTTLVVLARTHCAEMDWGSSTGGTLTIGEERLLESVERGETARFGEDDEQGQDPLSKETWGDERHIRAELVRWLCTDSKAKAYISPSGITMRSALLVGRLDLTFVDITFPLGFFRCRIEEPLSLTYTTVRALSFRGSVVRTIDAQQLQVKGNLTLEGVSAHGGVDLLGARIAGRLRADNAHLYAGTNRYALNLEGAHVEGSVLLRRTTPTVQGGFYAAGSTPKFAAVRLLSCTIDGDLECDGAILSHQGDVAFDGSRLKVGGNTHLRQGLYVRGELVLMDASLGGSLDCNRATFRNAGKRVINARRTVVKSSVFFTDFGSSDGLIDLGDTTIGGDLRIATLQFEGDAETGVLLERASITGVLLWINVHCVTRTGLVLDHATAGRFGDNESSWPAVGNLSLAGFRYGGIDPGSLDTKTRIRWLRLQARERFSTQPYEQFATVLRSYGLDSAARHIAIARENARRRHEGIRVFRWRPQGMALHTWLGSHLLRITIGYGYAPGRTLIWLILFVSLGAGLFWIGEYHNHCVMVPADEMPNTCNPEVGYLAKAGQTFSPIVYSLDTFLPIVDLRQKSRWLPNPAQRCTIAGHKLPCGTILRRYLWVHTIFGWMLTSLAVAGFTGLVRRS